MLHFTSKVVTFRVNVTFCVKSCYISLSYYILRSLGVVTFCGLSPALSYYIVYNIQGKITEC